MPTASVGAIWDTAEAFVLKIDGRYKPLEIRDPDVSDAYYSCMKRLCSGHRAGYCRFMDNVDLNLLGALDVLLAEGRIAGKKEANEAAYE